VDVSNLKLLHSINLHPEGIDHDAEPINKEYLYNEWIKAMTDEQRAISNLLEAQASYIRAFIGESKDFPTSPNNQHIHNFQFGVAKMLEAINEKQRLHMKMIDVGIYLFQEGD